MIQDFQTNEVRIRNEMHFVQLPTNTQAGEELTVGVFAQIGAEGDYFSVGANERATHLIVKSTLKKSGVAVGTIAEGDPVIAITGGPGGVRIPVASDVVAGQKLTTNNYGYAVGWEAGSEGADAHIVGDALEDILIDPETGLGWGECLISLPSSIASASQTSEITKG